MYIKGINNSAGLLLLSSQEMSFIIAPFLKSKLKPIFKSLLDDGEVNRVIKFEYAVTSNQNEKQNEKCLRLVLKVEFPNDYKVLCPLADRWDLLADAFRCNNVFLCTTEDIDLLLKFSDNEPLTIEESLLLATNTLNIKDGLDIALMEYATYLKIIGEGITKNIGYFKYWM